MMLFKISMIYVWCLCVCFILYRRTLSKRISELERRTADHDSKLYNAVVRGAKNTRNRVAEIEKQNGYKSRKKAHRNV